MHHFLNHKNLLPIFGTKIQRVPGHNEEAEKLLLRHLKNAQASTVLHMVRLVSEISIRVESPGGYISRTSGEHPVNTMLR